MKNTATPPQASGRHDVWAVALRRFDRDLQRRGAAERTRRAYGADIGELATWAAAQGIEPSAMTYRVLRGYAARLSDRGAAPRTLARKLASSRAFFRSMVEHGDMAANPADLLPAPKRPAAAAAHDQGERRRDAAGPDPGDDAARAARPRAVRARLRLRTARRGAREPRRRIGRLRRRAGARGGQGREDPLRPRRRARAGCPDALPGARPDRALGGLPATPRCSSPSPAGGSRPPTCAAVCACGRGTPRLRARCIPTPSAIRSRPICWRAGRTCARSRSCSATLPSPLPRSTLG